MKQWVAPQRGWCSVDFSGHHILTCAALVSFLPAGAKVGHRSLLRYYKQRFGAQRTVALSHNRNAVGRVLRQYRALGWGGDGGKTTSALGTASDLCPTKEHKKLEYADQTVKYSKLNHSLFVVWGWNHVGSYGAPRELSFFSVQTLCVVALLVFVPTGSFFFGGWIPKKCIYRPFLLT